MRVVAVLSGGGAKAAAHIGALRALREFKLHPSAYVGTSMGAVIAALHASGLEYDQVVQRITTLSRRDVAFPSLGAALGPFASGLFRAKKFKHTLSRLVPAKSFADLTAALTVTAVDAATGELTLFGTGGRTDVPLIEALYASCALPLYYPPARIDGKQYVDGGLRSVLPLDAAAASNPDMIFAVMVGPNPTQDVDGTSRGLLGAHNTALRILMGAQTEEVLARWDDEAPCDMVLVRPELGPSATFAVDKMVSFIEEGYRAAYRELAQSLKSL